MKRVLLTLQSVLCVMFAVMLAAGVIRLYREGIAFQADGHPSAWIFTRENTGRLLLLCLPVFLLSAGVTIVSLIAGMRAQERELMDKLLPRHRMGRPVTAANTHINAARAAVLTAAVVFIVLGIFNGSMRDVLYKAINICTECIGLG